MDGFDLQVFLNVALTLSDENLQRLFLTAFVYNGRHEKYKLLGRISQNDPKVLKISFLKAITKLSWFNVNDFATLLPADELENLPTACQKYIVDLAIKNDFKEMFQFPLGTNFVLNLITSGDLNLLKIVVETCGYKVNPKPDPYEWIPTLLEEKC